MASTSSANLDNYGRRDNLLPTTSFGEGTSNRTYGMDVETENAGESDVDPPREPGPDGAELALPSEVETLPVCNFSKPRHNFTVRPYA